MILFSIIVLMLITLYIYWLIYLIFQSAIDIIGIKSAIKKLESDNIDLREKIDYYEDKEMEEQFKKCGLWKKE